MYEVKQRNRSKYSLWEGERSFVEKGEAGNIRRRSAVFTTMIGPGHCLRSIDETDRVEILDIVYVVKNVMD